MSAKANRGGSVVASVSKELENVRRPLRSRVDRSVAMKRALAVGVIVLMGAAACTTSVQLPDLGRLYDQAAQHHKELRNPAIVIPGILGSRLTDSTSGRTVWGTFGGGAAHPHKPDGALLVSLPMREGAALRELREPRRRGRFGTAHERSHGRAGWPPLDAEPPIADRLDPCLVPVQRSSRDDERSELFRQRSVPLAGRPAGLNATRPMTVC